MYKKIKWNQILFLHSLFLSLQIFNGSWYIIYALEIITHFLRFHHFTQSWHPDDYLTTGTLRSRFDDSLWGTELPFPCRVVRGVDPIRSCPITGGYQTNPQEFILRKEYWRGTASGSLRACSDGAVEIPCVVSYQSWDRKQEKKLTNLIFMQWKLIDVLLTSNSFI